MKLSHRDFRPQRRSKYVAQPPKRRPTLRILLLAAIGVAVYLKFDTLVASPAFRSLRQPARLLDTLFRKVPAPLETSAPSPGLTWAADSGSVEADCASGPGEACLEAWPGLGREALGALRAVLGKVESQWAVRPDRGFTALFHRIPDASDPLAEKDFRLELTRLDLRGAKGGLLLERVPGKAPQVLCSREHCLDERGSRPPFANFRQGKPAPAADPAEARIPEAALVPLGGNAATPILRGRVMEIPAEGRPWVKIYHGEDIFSYYRGFASLHAGLGPGSMVNIGDTLGTLPGQGDSVGALDIRIEKGGLMVDPYAFLGLRPDSGGAGDAR